MSHQSRIFIKERHTEGKVETETKQNQVTQTAPPIDTSITKSSIQALHTHQVSMHGHTNKDKTLDIVGALGGIDIVLQTCLESIDTLSTTQLHKIHQILALPRSNNNSHRLISKIAKSPLKNKSALEESDFGYTFDPKKAFMYSMFSEQKATKIISLIFHKYTIIFAAIIFLIGQALINYFQRFGDHFDMWVYFVYGISIQFMVYYPWLILIILSSNKAAFKKITYSFDFVQKILWTVMYGGAGIVHYFWAPIYHGGFAHYHTPFYRMTRTIETIGSDILLVLCVIVVALFDSNPWIGAKSKMLLSLAPALYFTWISVQWQFLSPGSLSITVPISSVFGSEFSFGSFFSDSSRIVAIFAWKQAIMAYVRKGKCVSIKYVPYIYWQDSPKVASQSAPVTVSPVEIQMSDIKVKGGGNSDCSISMRSSTQISSVKL